MWLVNRFRGLLNPTTEDGSSLKSVSQLDTVQVVQWEMPSLLETEKHFRKNSSSIIHFVTPLLHRQIQITCMCGYLGLCISEFESDLILSYSHTCAVSMAKSKICVSMQ